MQKPLVLQIQEAVINDGNSVTKALRLAKMACAKLGLSEFVNWVNLELTGYQGKAANELPPYRKLQGNPVAKKYTNYTPMRFNDDVTAELMSKFFVFDPVSNLEELIKRHVSGNIYCAFDSLREKQFIQWHGSDYTFAMEISPHQFVDICDNVKDILLTWTLDLESQGVLGEGLMFTLDEKAKSQEPTAQVITTNHISVQNLGSLVQGDANGVVMGSTGSISVGDVENLVEQIDNSIPVLPEQIRKEVSDCVAELKNELVGAKNPGKIKSLLTNTLSFCGKVAGNVAAAGIAVLIKAQLSL